MIKAIVYRTNTGSAEEYAKLFANKTGLPAYSTDEAKKNLTSGTEIIFFGWVMARGIKGYKAAANRFSVRVVCAVGMAKTGGQVSELRNKNRIPDNVPLFTLQGNFDVNRLHGVYRIMMGIMLKTLGKALKQKTDRTEEENDMLDMMVCGDKRVNSENLKAVLEWHAAYERK